MTEMESKPSVFEAWNAVMRDVLAVRKDERNTHQNFNFRGIDAVMNAAGPALRDHGVVVVPEAAEAAHRDVTYGSNNTKGRECTVAVTYRVYGPAGDSFTMQTVAESIDSGDKGTAKAMSIAYRIALLQSLTVPTDEPDPDSYTYERSEPAGQAEPAKAGNRWLELGWQDQQEHDDALADLARQAQELTEEDRTELKEAWRQNIEATPISLEQYHWWENLVKSYVAQVVRAEAEAPNQ